MIKPYHRLLIVLMLLLISIFVEAQKVGLVLSGGGSKGVSHIGVIRALEEAEIPIDYITGTSMGAIIGGLYAAGYSPDEMEALLSSREFEFWSKGQLDPRYSYYFKAPTQTASWLDFKFKVDSAIRPYIPTNLISPVMMDFGFVELFSAASAVAEYDFDSLMVPFRCVASDIFKAQAVILERGDLGQAIRASMTYPFYFKPIRIDSVLLFDGGMYNNFPSDVMIEHFNPDIIIGSQASTNASEPHPDNVKSQLENMLMMKTDFDVICESSVLIKHNLPKLNVVDFTHSKAIIDSGYLNTVRMIPEIRKFLTIHRAKQEIDSIRRRFNTSKPELNIGSIKINGLRKSQYHYMNNLLNQGAFAINNQRLNSSGLTLAMVKPQYFKFIAEGKISEIHPALLYDSTNKDFQLTIDIERQNQLVSQIGGAVTSTSVNELFLQFQYFLLTSKSFQFTANSYFGRFYNSALLEARIDFPKHNPYFFTGGFVFNKFNYFKTTTYFYADNDPFFLIEQEQFGYLQLGFPYKNDGKLTIDMSFGNTADKYYQTNSYTSEDRLDRTAFRFIAPGLVFEINSLNHKEYPTSGVNFKAEGYLINGSEKFYPGTTSTDVRILNVHHTWLQVGLLYENYFAKIQKFKFGFYSRAFYSTQSFFTNHTASVLSAAAFQPVPESIVRFMPSYRASKYLAVGSKNILSLAKNFDFRLEGYMLLRKDVPTRDPVLGRTRAASFLYFDPMASSSLVYRTPIGPVSLEVNYFSGEEKPVSFFFKLGYLIFNRRPF